LSLFFNKKVTKKIGKFKDPAKAAFIAQARAARRQPYQPPRGSCRAKFSFARALGAYS
jgi:hypothetical protein